MEAAGMAEKRWSRHWMAVVGRAVFRMGAHGIATAADDPVSGSWLEPLHIPACNRIVPGVDGVDDHGTIPER